MIILCKLVPDEGAEEVYSVYQLKGITLILVVLTTNPGWRLDTSDQFWIFRWK